MPSVCGCCRSPRNLLHVRPKLRYLWHIARQAAYMSPRLAWCFGNEDFVGKMAVLGQAERHGLTAVMRSQGMVKRYAMAMGLRMLFREQSPL